VKDFDVWSFFGGIPGAPIPRRRVVACDFGKSKFGKSLDRPDFIGRRVDLLLKSLTCSPANNPVASLREYLIQGRTATARFLREKAVVIIEPVDLEGVMAWP
jgi:hypothetical protein